MPAQAESAGSLFESYHLALYRYLRRLTGSGELAEELTQDVFVRALEQSDKYDERGRERAWLFTIARNLALDRRRQNSRKGQESSLLESSQVSQPAHQFLQASLDELLSQLPEDDRDMFLLRESGGLSYAEIAALCGVTRASVRSHIYRARCALRSALKPAGEPASRAVLPRAP